MPKKAFSPSFFNHRIRVEATVIAGGLILIAILVSIFNPSASEHTFILPLVCCLVIGLLCAILPGEVRVSGVIHRMNFATKGAVASFLIGIVIANSIIFESPRATGVASQQLSRTPTNSYSLPAESVVRISGHVLDMNQNGICGAVVKSNKGRRTSTDADGYFALEIPQSEWAEGLNSLNVSRPPLEAVDHDLVDRDLRSITLHLGAKKK